VQVRLRPDGTCDTLRHLVNPGVPMPLAAANTHRITDAHVAGTDDRFCNNHPQLLLNGQTLPMLLSVVAACNLLRIAGPHMDAFAAGKPRFATIAAEIWRFFAGADILGYNALRFDVPLLAAEFVRLQSGGGGGAGGKGRRAAGSVGMEFPRPGALPRLAHCGRPHLES